MLRAHRGPGVQLQDREAGLGSAAGAGECPAPTQTQPGKEG